MDFLPGTLSEIVELYYYRHNPTIRSPDTRRQYTYALTDFAAALGHAPTLGDLNDDAIASLLAYLQSRALAPKTCNERAGRIVALWRWLYQRRHVDRLPLAQQIPVPRKTPLAWTREELDRLLAACGEQRGMIEGIPASWWWLSLHLVLWDSGERIGALIQSRWEWLTDGWLVIPAEVRKAKTEDRTYHLSSESQHGLEMIARPRRELIWPWPYHPAYLWTVYKTIRERAGLASDRRSSFHRMRRSVASHFEAAGGNATELLGHSDRRLTRNSYLDPRIAKHAQAADLLFRLNPHDRSNPPGS